VPCIGHQGGRVGNEALSELDHYKNHVKNDSDDKGSTMIVGIAMIMTAAMQVPGMVVCVVVIM